LNSTFISYSIKSIKCIWPQTNTWVYITIYYVMSQYIYWNYYFHESDLHFKKSIYGEWYIIFYTIWKISFTHFTRQVFSIYQYTYYYIRFLNRHWYIFIRDGFNIKSYSNLYLNLIQIFQTLKNLTEYLT